MVCFAAGILRDAEGGSETSPYGISGDSFFGLILVFAPEIQAGFVTGDQARDIWTMFDQDE